jgi:hypothetical protein
MRAHPRGTRNLSTHESKAEASYYAIFRGWKPAASIFERPVLKDITHAADWLDDAAGSPATFAALVSPHRLDALLEQLALDLTSEEGTL